MPEVENEKGRQFSDRERIRGWFKGMNVCMVCLCYPLFLSFSLVLYLLLSTICLFAFIFFLSLPAPFLGVGENRTQMRDTR